MNEMVIFLVLYAWYADEGFERAWSWCVERKCHERRWSDQNQIFHYKIVCILQFALKLKLLLDMEVKITLWDIWVYVLLINGHIIVSSQPSHTYYFSRTHIFQQSPVCRDWLQYIPCNSTHFPVLSTGCSRFWFLFYMLWYTMKMMQDIQIFMYYKNIAI